MAFVLLILTKFADVQQHHMKISGAECHPNRIVLAAVCLEDAVRSSLVRVVTRRHTECLCSSRVSNLTGIRRKLQNIRAK